MNDFNYEIETIDRYYFENFTVDGKAVQNGTPTPSSPVPVEVVEPVDGVFGISVNSVVTPIDLQGNVIASLPDGTKDVLTIDSTGAVTLEKQVGIKTLNGSESWTYYASWNGNDQYCYYTKFDDAPSNHGSIVPLCDFLIGYLRTQFSGNDKPVDSCAFDNSRDFCVRVPYSSKTDFTTWLTSNPQNAYYKLATPQTIDLGIIDVSSLQNIPEETPISIVATLDPVTDYSYSDVPTYQVINPYENANAPEYAFPPNHYGQEWETFDANDWTESGMLDYTGQPESHAVYTVELCELMQSGAFNWKRSELDWSDAAYNQEQYERFCEYFEQRFMFREISMLPPLHWFVAFKRMMVYELMPKYKPLYAQVESGLAPLGENEYYKERHISSLYPETMLSGNSDYISSGEDKEWERVKVNNAAEALEAYRNGFRSVDAALGDELEVLFISMYTSFANAL